MTLLTIERERLNGQTGTVAAPDLRAVLRLVTPTLAAEWLTRNTMNRPLSKETVQKYASAMLRGEWTVNGETVVIAATNELLDGQHRLHAVVKSGVSVQMLVILGIDKKTFRTMGGVKPRTAANDLAIAGEAGAKGLSSALNLLYFLRSGLLETTVRPANYQYPSRTQVAEMIEQHPSIRESHLYGHNNQKHTFANPTSLAVAHYVLTQLDRDSAEEFFALAKSGVGLPEKSPILALRSWLMNCRIRHQKVPNAHQLAIIFLAWNKWRDGDTAHLIRFAPGVDKFPVPH